MDYHKVKPKEKQKVFLKEKLMEYLKEKMRGNIEIAKSLVRNKVDMSIIVDSTGLTEDEINTLK